MRYFGIAGLIFTVMIALIIHNAIIVFSIPKMQKLDGLEVFKGDEGYGLTVFEGMKPRRFRIKVEGRFPPAQRLGKNEILIRCLDAICEKKGIFQGMSGSPVYVNDRFVGAVSFGYPHSIEPVAGLMPADKMFQVWGFEDQSNRERNNPTSLSGFPGRLLNPGLFGETKNNVLNVVSESSVSQKSRNNFFISPNSLDLKPGESVGIRLVGGDLRLFASGTVSFVKGRRVLLFAHGFESTGVMDLPMFKMSVQSILANRVNSFRLHSPVHEVGRITFDSEYGISGVLGEKAIFIPLNVSISGKEKQTKHHFQISRTRDLAWLFSKCISHMFVDWTGASEIAKGMEVSWKIVWRDYKDGKKRIFQLDNVYLNRHNSVDWFSQPQDKLVDDLFKALSMLSFNDVDKTYLDNVGVVSISGKVKVLDRLFYRELKQFDVPSKVIAGRTFKLRCRFFDPETKKQFFRIFSICMPKYFKGDVIVEMLDGVSYFKQKWKRAKVFGKIHDILRYSSSTDLFEGRPFSENLVIRLSSSAHYELRGKFSRPLHVPFGLLRRLVHYDDFSSYVGALRKEYVFPLKVPVMGVHSKKIFAENC